MRPRHHLPDELLMSYAAGATPEALGLLVATHATLCPECRARLAHYEALGGTLLEQERPVEVSDGLFGRLMQELAGASTQEKEAYGPRPDPKDIRSWPRPLLEYVKAQEWRFYAPGVKCIALAPRWGEVPARVFRLAPGYVVPRHAHEGQEFTLVLSGGYQDSGQHFVRGDVAVRGREEAHEIRVDRDEPCVTLVVNEGYLVPLTLPGKLLQLFRKT